MGNTSDRAKYEAVKNDTCPSPLDESETIHLLGSDDKMKINDLHTSRLGLDQY